jgi:hypothetical protein
LVSFLGGNLLSFEVLNAFFKLGKLGTWVYRFGAFAPISFQLFSKTFVAM